MDYSSLVLTLSLSSVFAKVSQSDSSGSESAHLPEQDQTSSNTAASECLPPGERFEQRGEDQLARAKDIRRIKRFLSARQDTEGRKKHSSKQREISPKRASEM